MKTIKTALIISIAISAMAITFNACSDDSGPKELNIISMLVGNADLNAAVSPSNVPVDASIVITFNSPINAASANPSTISLTQEYDGAIVPVVISVDNATLTIDPVENMGSGVLHQLDLRAGLLNTEDQPLAQTSRTFTTAGTFSPAGAIAYWTFEDSAEDVAGNYNPAPNGVVDVTYEPGRNAEAGKAATFNGTTSIIEIPNGDELITTEDFTLNFWVKTNSQGKSGGHFVIGLGAFLGLQYEIFGDYTGAKFAMRFVAADGTSVGEDMWFPAEATDANSGGWQGWDYAKSLTPEQMIALLKDNWLHVTLTFEGSARKASLYYNGEIMKSFDFNLWPEGSIQRTVTGMHYNGTPPEVVNELAFGFIQSRAGTLWANESWGGYQFPDANHFKGQLDDIRIYHKVLTPTEIRLMYESER
ncbi:MAG: LamG-like jellyroll fold domain-containing protein [Cyclonatronaceae bacterium]